MTSQDPQATEVARKLTEAFASYATARGVTQTPRVTSCTHDVLTGIAQATVMGMIPCPNVGAFQSSVESAFPGMRVVMKIESNNAVTVLVALARRTDDAAIYSAGAQSAPPPPAPSQGTASGRKRSWLCTICGVGFVLSAAVALAIGAAAGSSKVANFLGVEDMFARTSME